MYNLFIISLMTIAPYNTDAFVLLRVILMFQLYWSRMLSAMVAPFLIR